MGHSMGCGPEEDQKKKNHRGDKGASYELPMNEERPAPLPSGKIIGIVCAPTGEREALP